MLTPQIKADLDLIFDRLGTLAHVRWDPVSSVVELDFKINVEHGDTEPPEEYWDWPSKYSLRLTGIGRIFISPHKEAIPSELANSRPSIGLMSFLLRTFEDQGIYEWTTFPDPGKRFTGAWSVGWDYLKPCFSADLDFACIFKERGEFPHGSACWVAGFWFQELNILTDSRENEIVPINVFISRYRSYAEKVQG